MVAIVFLHPDLGIGGAERLVVDAALALQQKGHSVQFVTSHHDPSHCFSETADGTFVVTVVGDWLPRSFLGRFYALCAYIRMIYAAIYISFFSELQPQIIFCDLISVCIPILRIAAPHILFYCHFPDQLLSKPGSKLKSVYRAPLNWFEEYTTGKADKVFVNSKFTGGVFKDTFKRLKITPDILYPSLNTDFFDSYDHVPLNQLLSRNIPDNSTIFLSINRYERKKNLALAILALSKLQSNLTSLEWQHVHLLMIGGYDTRVVENVEYYEELVTLTSTLQLTEKVSFFKSPSDIEKASLLTNCSCLLYTPENEHFGIVPLEAMYAMKPVIACNSGGPTETIVNGVTGFLCNPKPEDFSSSMFKCVKDVNLCKQMGTAGRKRITENFSFEAFADQLEVAVQSLFELKGKKD